VPRGAGHLDGQRVLGPFAKGARDLEAVREEVALGVTEVAPSSQQSPWKKRPSTVSPARRPAGGAAASNRHRYSRGPSLSAKAGVDRQCPGTVTVCQAAASKSWSVYDRRSRSSAAAARHPSASSRTPWSRAAAGAGSTVPGRVLPARRSPIRGRRGVGSRVSTFRWVLIGARRGSTRGVGPRYSPRRRNGRRRGAGRVWSRESAHRDRAG